MVSFIKIAIPWLFFTLVAFAEVEPLFYGTYNFAENDRLNIREKPNYRSKKIGELYLGSLVQLFTCVNVKASKWCQVEGLYFPEARGWVNAKYIKPTRYQEGYVNIKGLRSDCYYVLKCAERNHQNQCLVVTGLGESMEKISLQTQWFNRSRLTPATQFSAMTDDPDASGYCNSMQYIDAYQRHQKLKELAKKFPTPAFAIVRQFITFLAARDEKGIQKLIHPKNGLTLSALSYFNKQSNQYFNQKTFLSTYRGRKKLFWGHTEAKGDVIEKDLYSYFETLPSDIPHISKVVRLHNFKNYPKKPHQKLEAYEVYWTFDEPLTEYNYQGLVVILEAYAGQWYVVGITKDYWTP